MAEDNQPAPAAAADAVPSLNLLGQYIRDLSFENPGAPGSILTGGPAPQFSVNINVGVKKQAEDVFAVELTMNARAEREGSVLFNVELVYGGVFRVRNVPEANLAPVLMIECPRLVFPFARQVLANVTQQGGFPPVMVDPVDFTQIYRQNMAAAAAKAKEGGDAQAPAPADGETPPTVN